MKAGDRVWVRETVEVAEDNAVWLRDSDDGNWWLPSEAVLPDHPALPAIAKWLEKFPGSVETLRELIVEAMPNMSDPRKVSVAYSFAYALEFES